MILIIDDDEIMAECIARGCGGGREGGADGNGREDEGSANENWCGNEGEGGREVRIFGNAIEAMNFIAENGAPEMIFLDILLDGPDGFTFLNELMSYADTATVPVVVVSSLDFTGRDLSAYNVVKILHKDTMVPAEIKELVAKYAK